MVYVQADTGVNMQISRWRCMTCGDVFVAEMGRDVRFSRCIKCNGSRWGFVDAALDRYSL
jgi:rubredoxin